MEAEVLLWRHRKALLWRQQNPPVEENTDPLQVAIPLSDTIPKVLGEEKMLQGEQGEVIHPDLAKCWEYLLKHGLDPNIRTDLVKKYPPIANCKLVAAPLRNEEVKVTVSESVLKRDERLATVQSQVGACLSALGKALNLLLQDEEKEDSKHLQLIELLNNTARMLADVHYQEKATARPLATARAKPRTVERFEVILRRGGGQVMNQVGYGGRLSNFIDIWRTITQDEVILSWLQGYKIPVRSSIAQGCPPHSTVLVRIRETLH
nr:unnamed protein product [Callosobruchus analis]